MQTERKGTGDTIRLRLKLSQKTTQELQSMLDDRDTENGRRFLHDKETRDAAAVVLRVRGQFGESQ